METDQLTPLIIPMNGGLVLNQDPFTQSPSTALTMINMEPSISGGYRKINGYIKFNTTALTGTGSVLGVGSYGGEVVACRGPGVYSSNGASSWSAITEARTNATFYTFANFYWSAADILIFTDGVNPAGHWTGSVYSTITDVNAPTAPLLCDEFNNSLVLTESNQLYLSVPFAETDFTGAGTVQFSLPGVITGVKKFRKSLYIFGDRFIRRLVGFGTSTYQMEAVADSVGCVATRSIQEIGGDLLFLAADGLRTIAGTEKIDDIEMGSVSRPIQTLLTGSAVPAPDTNYICSAVIRDKSQYRIFIPFATDEIDAEGVIAVFTDTGWQFGTTKGIKASCADDVRVGSDTFVVHGGFDGFVYRQESGKLFDTASVPFKFDTPEIIFDDPGLRQELQRLILNVDQEGKTRFVVKVKYNFSSSEEPQPEPYVVHLGTDLATYGVAKYGQDAPADKPTGFIRLPVEGSGFSASFCFEQDDSLTPTESSESFTMDGVQIEKINAGRR